MSSSPTETLGRRDDAPDGRLRRRGHDRRLAQAGRRLGGGRRDDLRGHHGQDRHRDAVAGRRAAGRDARGGGRDRRRRHARSRGSRPTPTAGRGPRGRAPSRDRRHAAAAAAPARRYSPVVQRIAAEHGIDLDARPGHGPRRPRAQAGRARARRRRAAATAARTRRCTRAPYRPDPTADARAARRRQRAALAHAPHDRRAHEALARDRGDVHDLDRGRHVAASRRAPGRSSA